MRSTVSAPNIALLKEVAENILHLDDAQMFPEIYVEKT